MQHGRYLEHRGVLRAFGAPDRDRLRQRLQQRFGEIQLAGLEVHLGQRRRDREAVRVPDPERPLTNLRGLLEQPLGDDEFLLEPDPEVLHPHPGHGEGVIVVALPEDVCDADETGVPEL